MPRVCQVSIVNMDETAYRQQLRRLPKQARSRERFNRVLDAAAKLFATNGYESVTTDEIATLAGTSVGGLYRFFPDKQAIFHALAARYLQRLGEVFSQLQASDASQIPLQEYINRVIDAFDRFVSENPEFRAVFVQARQVSTEVLAMDKAFNEEIAKQLAADFTLRNPSLSTSECRLIATISVEVTSTLEILAISSDNQQQQILAETKKLLLAYLQQYFP